MYTCVFQSSSNALRRFESMEMMERCDIICCLWGQGGVAVSFTHMFDAAIDKDHVRRSIAEDCMKIGAETGKIMGQLKKLIVLDN
jgi:hypothetical protein